MYKISYYHCVLCAFSRFNILLTITLLIYMLSSTHLVGDRAISMAFIFVAVAIELLRPGRLLRFSSAGPTDVQIGDTEIRLTPERYKLLYIILLIVIDTIIISNVALTNLECLEALLVVQFLIWVVTVVDEEIYTLLMAERSNTKGSSLAFHRYLTKVSGGIRVI